MINYTNKLIYYIEDDHLNLVNVENRLSSACRQDLLPVSGDEVLQLQQSVLAVLHHLLSVQMFHETRQDPAGSGNKHIHIVIHTVQQL